MEAGSVEENKTTGGESLKELEAALASCRAENAELERKVERATAAAKEMEYFAYAVAHDLKSPLRSMTSFTQLLTRRLPDNADIRDYAAHIIAGASEMQAVIDGVQKLAEVSKSQNRTHIRLDVILQLALLGLQTQLKECGGDVKFDRLPDVAINESQFVHLFEQLIKNSLIFRGAEQPRIQVSADETADGFTISVRDNGVGIEPQYFDRVFEPFKRLHGKDYPGIGLGLTISRRIVQAHGGRLWVESDGRSGSEFRFTIPIQ